MSNADAFSVMRRALAARVSEKRRGVGRSGHRHRPLNRYELAVLMSLVDIMGDDSPAEVSVRQIVTVAGGDGRQARRAMENLEAAGLIGRTPGMGRSASTVWFTPGAGS